MSLSRGIALLLLLGMATTGWAQRTYSLDNFTGLKSEGEIPADLRKSLAEIYSEDKQRVRDYNDGKLTNRDRVLEVSYNISRLMSNGRILYGDPITRMLEHMADTLLKDYPQLRSELRFYTVKSPAVNAFATGQGMIFVTTGLVAQAENESQLAYILSHEIIHYYRKHNMEMITRRAKTADDEASRMANFLIYHNRSHEMENEADSLGLTLFYINSPYDKRVSDGVFDVLQYAMLPFDEVPFDTLYFDSPYFKIPRHYYLAKVADITSRDDYDDSHSTHPNIKKRRARTGEILSHHQGGSRYVVTTPSEFAHIRLLARFECIRQCLIYNDYTRAFYDSYVMERQLPGNKFLLKAKAQALYGIAMVKSYRHTNEIVGDYNDYEGEIQQLYYLFRKLTEEEATLVAMREIWKTHLLMPNDTQLVDMGRDLMETLRDKHHLSRNFFSATFDTAYNPDAVEKEQPSANQKYARIRQKKQQSNSANLNRFAFTDFLQQDDRFRQFMDYCLDNKKPADSTDLKALSTLHYAPQYLVIENKKESPDIKYRKSDRMEKILIDEVHQAAEAAHLKVVDFSDPAMHNSTSDTFYNDFVAINEWANEFWQNKGLVPLRLSTQPQMDDINARYGTDKLTLNTVVNSEYTPRKLTPFSLLLGIAIPPVLPMIAYSIASNREITATRNMLIDTRRGRVLADQTNHHDYADSRDLVTNDIYTTYNMALKPNRTPGFLGRRLAVSANLNMGFPVLNHIFDRPGAIIDLRPSLNLEWTVAKHNTLSLNLDYNKTLFYIKNGYLPTGRYMPDGFAPLYNTTILGADLTHRWYTDISTAPLGTYWGAGASLSHINIVPQAEAYRRNALDSTYYRFGITLETGRNYIIRNKVLFNIGIRFHLTAANPFSYDPDLDFDATYEERLRKAENNPVRQLNADLWMANVFLLNIGVGFLPF